MQQADNISDGQPAESVQKSASMGQSDGVQRSDSMRQTDVVQQTGNMQQTDSVQQLYASTQMSKEMPTLSITPDNTTCVTPNSSIKKDFQLRGTRSKGVIDMEAILHSLNHRTTFGLFFCIFLLGYALSFDMQTRYSFQTYALNSLDAHSALTTVSTVQSVVAATILPILAHLANDIGRISVLYSGAFLFALGTLLMAVAGNLSTYAVGAVLYRLGQIIIQYIIDIISSDLSFMNWRMLVSVIPMTPYLINSWTGGYVTKRYLKQDEHGTVLAPYGWRWGIGQMGIIIPVLCLIFAAFLHILLRNAKHNENSSDAVKENNEQTISVEQFKNKQYEHEPQTLKESILYFIYRYNVTGLLLFCSSFAFFLTPLTLAGGNRSKWRSASILGPLCIACFILFPLFMWRESKSENPILSPRLWRNRGIWAPCILIFLMQVNWELQATYMFTVLQVAVYQTIHSATNIINLYTFCSTLVAIVVGIVMVKARHLKPFIMSGLTLWFISYGLLYHFRSGLNSKSGIIAAEVLMGVGGGLVTYTSRTAILAEVTHENMAILTSLFTAIYNIGFAFGSAMTGLIWGSSLPRSLHKRVTNQELADETYLAPLTVIMRYPKGTSERNEIVAGYRDTQRVLTLSALCIMALIYILGFFYRNRHLERNVQQQKAELSDSDECIYEDMSSLQRWKANGKKMFLEVFCKTK